MLSIARRAFAMGFALVLLAAMAGPGTADDKDKGEKKVELKVGDKAPGFEATADNSRTWVSGEHYGKKWVVIYFYPGDFTPGCTAQANAF